MTQVTIGGGRVVCEMDEAAVDEYKQVVGWLQKAIASRDDAYAALKVALAERDTARETHRGLVAERDAAIAERDALREEVGLLHAAIESDAESRIAAHDAANQARAFAADLREELAALRAIAQNALDHGGDRELVYAPLYQQALEDIADEPQDE